jgi:hypothetical protein
MEYINVTPAVHQVWVHGIRLEVWIFWCHNILVWTGADRVAKHLQESVVLQ